MLSGYKTCKINIELSLEPILLGKINVLFTSSFTLRDFNIMHFYSILFILLVSFSTISFAEIPFMSSQWAEKTCQIWNKNKALVKGLGGNWIQNNKKRGYKIIHLHRSECEKSPKVEFVISEQQNQAHCSYGGKVKHPQLDKTVDYYLYASDEDWHCMGKAGWGCGPMGAMMTGKLMFEGPKTEAMSVMDSFELFLKLTGQVKATEACPKE